MILLATENLAKQKFSTWDIVAQQLGMYIW